MSEDLELLSQWRGGDDEAGNALVQRHFASVFRFFRNKVEQGASDLTQQTFLALVEGRERLEPSISLRAYVLAIARHKLVHHLRDRYRAKEVFDPERDSVLDLHEDPGTSPTRRIADVERRRLLDQALRSLPLDHQIALEMHYWREMGIAEIATVLDTTPGGIKSRLFRARKALQQQIERLAMNPEPLLDHLDEELTSLDSE